MKLTSRRHVCLGLCASVMDTRALPFTADASGRVAEELAATAVPFDPALPLQRSGDLVSALRHVVDDARIVMLGEPSHGDGSAIRLRGELVELLHTRLGFDVLAFEADFWSINRGWASLRSPDQIKSFAEENIYDFWSRAPAAAGLWRHIARSFASGRRLDLAGIDCRFRGRIARDNLIRDLEAALRDKGINPPGDFGDFAATYRRLQSDEFGAAPQAREIERFYATINAIEKALQASRRDADLWIQRGVRSLSDWIGITWGNGSRDRALGANLVWLSENVFPGRKIIVWAHNNHIIKNPAAYLETRDEAIARRIAAKSEIERNSVTFLGSEAAKRFPGAVCSIAVIEGRGETSTQFPRALDGSRIDFAVTAPVPAQPPDSLEARLLERGCAGALCDLRRVSPSITFRSRTFDLSLSAEAPYAKGYDAIMFNRDAHGLLSTSEHPTSKQDEADQPFAK